ncbi:hypothetical protein [Paraburkholderia susongensis]|uniref:Uncharacterized protein n=1 Tax=Paraburkholderia susongensis TaxID=1515439 RepID=A0A1X7M5Q6_9BURK|nr:hypothetical protein [Paraburkholderia susongensis]SMG60729.1 hypothetical protein SAMN06265784_11797 [Paraburkholderia susongensis]
MQIVPFIDGDWKGDHPAGTIVFKHLLKGEPQSPDNFMYILGRQDGDFFYPRHRHNFDQIRLPLRGDMNLGHGVKLREGQIGYFPEGLAYGPQEDPLGQARPGERLQLVLQFGGASGYGFVSIEQHRQAKQEMSRAGRFDGPYYVRDSGKKEWARNAIWHHLFGTKLKYAHPRYKSVMIADPACFNWLPLKSQSGVERKYMGSFTERGVSIEMIRLHPGASWSSLDPHARRLLVVLSGSGEVEGQLITYLSALRVDPGESLQVRSPETLELFLIGLPPVEKPLTESGHYDLADDLTGDAVTQSG